MKMEAVYLPIQRLKPLSWFCCNLAHCHGAQGNCYIVVTKYTCMVWQTLWSKAHDAFNRCLNPTEVKIVWLSHPSNYVQTPMYRYQCILWVSLIPAVSPAHIQFTIGLLLKQNVSTLPHPLVLVLKFCVKTHESISTFIGFRIYTIYETVWK